MTVKKEDLIDKAYLSCLGSLSQQKITEIKDTSQDLLKNNISEFVLFLDSEGGEPIYAESLAYHLQALQNKGITISVCIERFAMSAAAIFILYCKYLGINVYAYSRSIIIFHEHRRSYEMSPISVLRKAIAREWEELQRALKIYSEISGIDEETLHQEFLEEKELDVAELKKRNLIDDIVE